MRELFQRLIGFQNILFPLNDIVFDYSKNIINDKTHSIAYSTGK